MSIIEKILLPVDGSDYMKREVELACEFSKIFGADVTIFHVIAMPMSSEVGGILNASKELEEAGNAILEEARQIAEGCGIKPKLELDFSVGNPGMRIIRKAEAEGANLIIIGAKGKNRFREILMGSVANTVVNNSKCLVLIVRTCD
jgi:nucleotide-binding universal stress UspA family protein